MKKKLLLIINPHAGRASIKNYTLEIIDHFVRKNYEVTCYTTQKTGDPARIVEEHGEGYDRIVCCGGDGTVNESLNGVMKLDSKPEFGVIPVGVTNDYAYSLSIPSAPDRAADVASGNNLFTIDIGLFGKRYFAYVAAFGLFTDVTWQTSQDLKNNLGGFAYFMEGVRRFTDFKEYHIRVEYDTGFIEGDYIVGLFSNSISIAGLRTAYSNAILDDGLMEIALIKKPTHIEDYHDFIDVMLNNESASDLNSDLLQVIHTSKAVVSCDEHLTWTVDGESGGDYKSVSIQIIQQALRVVAGRDMRDNSIVNAAKKTNQEINLI